MTMDFWMQAGWGLLLLLLIVADCAMFTNAIEWLGKRLNLSDGAVGSVLAAVGTALPETLMPIVALSAGLLDPNMNMSVGQDIGVGAILGAPFLLSTLAMGLTGLTFLLQKAFGKRDGNMRLDMPWSRRDLKYFFIAYAILISGHFFPAFAVRVFMAITLLMLYGLYVTRTLIKAQKDTALSEEVHDELQPLWFAPKYPVPSMLSIWLQVWVSLGVLVWLAHEFVEVIHHTAQTLQIAPLILSLLIIPIATELPEKFNSVVWVLHKKDNLALGNLTGAMVFQSCLPGVVGLLMTPWHLEGLAWANVIFCVVSTAVMFLFARGGPLTPWVFASGGLMYLGYLAYVWKTVF